MIGLLSKVKQDRITAKYPHPPQHFLYQRETKSWWCEEGGGGEEEKVHLLTHATARGVGKKMWRLDFAQNPSPLVDLIHQNVLFFYFYLP